MERNDVLSTNPGEIRIFSFQENEPMVDKTLSKKTEQNKKRIFNIVIGSHSISAAI